jgi:Ca-activated chloride channel family protein
MTFALPHVLWLLALPALLLVWELRRKGSISPSDHPKILRAEAGLRTISLVEDPSASQPGGRRRYLLCAGIALGVVALARPQWGRLDKPVFDQSRDIIIALDLSRSMLTPDVKPSRLDRSKLLIQSLLDHLKGERVGLIVFSGSAFLQSPVSADYEILRDFLPSLNPDYLPEGGTNYRQLLDTAIEEFGSGASADRYLIILSDGEATDEDWRDRVPELEKKGVRVIGLGVGTASGAMIPDGTGGFMKDDNGAVVLSKLESGTLKELAAATHETYVDASEWVDLPKIIAHTVAEGRKGKFVEHTTVRYAERFQWALAQALVCLAASFWLEFPVKPKAREIKLGAAPSRPARTAAAALALALILILPGARAADGDASDLSSALGKIVARLSEQDNPKAQDWAEFCNETVLWGERLQSSGQQVPEKPVRDALKAADLGELAGPKAADWSSIKNKLEDLLKKSEQQKQDQKQQQDQNKQDQKNQDDKQQDQQQKQDEQKDQKQQQDQQKQGQQGKPEDKQGGGQQDQQQQGAPKQNEKKPGNPNDAFGKMDQNQPSPEPTPRPAQQMQKVGGERKDQPIDPAKSDPALAVPLEKLEKVKTGDSPAELFDMLRRSEPMPTPTKTGKNW